MKNAYRVLTLFVVASFGAINPLAAAGAQWEEGEILYERYYYSDASYSQQVGYERDRCTYYGKGGGPTQGYITPYVEEVPFARCVNGQLAPY